MGCGESTDSGVTRFRVWGLLFILTGIVYLNESISSFKMFYMKNTAYKFREKVRIGALREKKVSEELSKTELPKVL